MVHRASLGLYFFTVELLAEVCVASECFALLDCEMIPVNRFCKLLAGDHIVALVIV